MADQDVEADTAVVEVGGHESVGGVVVAFALLEEKRGGTPSLLKVLCHHVYVCKRVLAIVSTATLTRGWRHTHPSHTILHWHWGNRELWWLELSHVSVSTTTLIEFM